VDAKSKAKRFCREYGIKNLSIEKIKKIIESQGYTIIEFNYIFNDKDVQTLIDVLGLSEELIRSRGFTYVDSNRRLVFVNEDLSEHEKLIVLAHEEGHIYCKHFSHGNIIGVDVQDEHEANEFEHFILNISKIDTVIMWAQAHMIALIITLIILFVAGIGIWKYQEYKNREASYYGEYYITGSGQKYHEKDCIHVKNKTNVYRLTIEQFESGDYEACKTCLP